MEIYNIWHFFLVAGFDRVTDGSIYEVTTQDYNSCNPSNPLAYFFGYGGYALIVGPFPVTQTYPQAYLFVEADATNCTAGMKLDATVYDPASVPPPPAPSPTTSVNASTTPPAPSPTTSVNAPTTPSPPPPPSIRTSPPGPPAPATPPLQGQAVPTTGNGTSSKLSAGAKAGIAIAGVISALGLGGIAVKVGSMECCTRHYHISRSFTRRKEKHDDEKQELSNKQQKLQSIDVYEPAISGAF